MFADLAMEISMIGRDGQMRWDEFEAGQELMEVIDILPDQQTISEATLNKMILLS